jgi:hypothetical protein
MGAAGFEPERPLACEAAILKEPETASTRGVRGELPRLLCPVDYQGLLTITGDPGREGDFLPVGETREA